MSSLPRTIDEAVITLIKNLSKSELMSLRSTPKSDLDQLNFGLGGWIRNNFGLWNGTSPLLQERLYVTGDDDKDLAAGFDRPAPKDVSQAIISATWEHLQQEMEWEQ